MSRKGIPYRPDLRQKSRELRHDGTLGEALLWQELRARQLGVGFRRQVPMGKYIVDFFCKELSLVIEIDGSNHDHSEQWSYDLDRQAWLERRGMRVIRVTEGEVRANPEGIANWIRDIIEEMRGG